MLYTSVSLPLHRVHIGLCCTDVVSIGHEGVADAVSIGDEGVAPSWLGSSSTLMKEHVLTCDHTTTLVPVQRINLTHVHTHTHHPLVRYARNIITQLTDLS